MGFTFRPKNNSNKYKFVEYQQASLGSLMILIPITGHRIIKLNADVVPADVPILIGIDVLDKYKMYPNTVKTKFFCPELDIDIPPTLKYVHVFLEL